MSLPLPDLLRALAEIFGRPGRFPAGLLKAASNAFWVSGPLKVQLEGMLESNPEELAVAYTDGFVVSRAHPLLYLEASVQRTGLLRDPALLQDLDRHYGAFDFDLPEGLAPDHLAAELEALASGLDRLGATSDAELPRFVPDLMGLIDLHLLPLLTELNLQALRHPLHPFYAAALRAAQACVELSREGLFAFN